MKTIKQHYFKIFILLTILSYVLIVMVLHKPISFFLTFILIISAISIIAFLGNTIGAIAVFYQQIFKKEPIKIYELAYKKGATNATILMSYSLCLLRQKEYTKALQVIEKGLKHSNYFVVTKSLMTNKAVALFKVGKIEDAISEYLKILKIFGKEKQDYFKKENVSMDTVIEQNIYFTTADFTTLAYFYMLNDELDNAIYFTRCAITKDKNFAAAYDNLGQISLKKDDTKQAIHHFNKALSINYNLVDSLYFLSKIHFDNGDYDKSSEYIKRIDKNRIDGLDMIELNDVVELENNIVKMI